MKFIFLQALALQRYLLLFLTSSKLAHMRLVGLLLQLNTSGKNTELVSVIFPYYITCILNSKSSELIGVYNEGTTVTVWLGSLRSGFERKDARSSHSFSVGW